MQNQFTPDADEHDETQAKKSSQQRLLLLLLLLIALFAYLYFFTGLIKPRTDEAAAPAPETAAQQAPTVVKKPLPPRPEASASAEATADKSANGTEATADKSANGAEATAGKPSSTPAPASAKATAGEPAKPAPTAAAKPAAPAASAKPAPAAAAKPAAPAAPAKPAPAAAAKPAAPAAAAKPAATAKEAKPAAKEAKPAAATKETKTAAAKPAAKETKPAAKEAKQAAAAKPAKEAKAAKTAKAETAAPSKSAKPAAKAATGVYALDINGDLAESEMGPVTAKLKKAGISHLVKIKTQKGEPMHRLFLADFGDRNEAIEQLGRLKQVAPNAFMLKENGRYAVYGGSFMREGKAAVEQDRLFDKGVKLLLQKATIPVSVVKLRAGSFPDQASAQKAAANLKSAGLSAKVVKVGK
ncbi:sporulation domain protein [Geoanaerobacter pelophilus]|uniref:Sporulation domain protein n=1 Tax=Geoanaerobacter pelophilus TaxID=60036 RepID=A0ABQ0MGN3_9BACT|nr:SPOR domain-containing protein [Geoanaerobacter pelophilus]GAW66204.1 sporulation domain protein [Geoanaerobacter pelophilus]